MIAREGKGRDGGLFATGAARPAATLIAPARAALGHRNRLSNFTFFLLAAVGGSAASAAAVALAGWSLISIGAKRFRPRFERSDAPVLVSCVLFFLVIAGTSLFHAAQSGDMPAAWRSVGERLLFLLPLLLVARMRCSRYADTLPPAFLGSAVGGLVLIPLCLVLLQVKGGRLSGLAGNPGPFAMMALLAAGWALLSLPSDRPSSSRVVLAVLGAAGAALAVVLSGMRGTWPALPAVVLVAVIAQRRQFTLFWRQWRFLARAVAASVLALLLVAGAFVAAPLVASRFAAGVSDLSGIAANVDEATSLNLRRSMYEAASQAIAARPWFGYGQEARWDAVRPYLDSRAFENFSFSHLHNVFLTIGIEAGLIGILALVAMVAAPVWTAWRARRTIGGGRRLAAALILVIAFLVPGLTNIMFFHDILDSVWVFAVALIAASVLPQAERAP
jgi:O-antigen ligase